MREGERERRKVGGVGERKREEGERGEVEEGDER